MTTVSSQTTHPIRSISYFTKCYMVNFRILSYYQHVAMFQRAYLWSCPYSHICLSDCPAQLGMSCSSKEILLAFCSVAVSAPQSRSTFLGVSLCWVFSSKLLQHSPCVSTLTSGQPKISPDDFVFPSQSATSLVNYLFILQSCPSTCAASLWPQSHSGVGRVAIGASAGPDWMCVLSIVNAVLFVRAEVSSSPATGSWSWITIGFPVGCQTLILHSN